MSHITRSVLFSLSYLLANIALASPSVEQVKQLMETTGIPQWQKAAAQAKALRANPPSASAAETWKSLDQATDATTGKAPLARVTTPRDANDFQDVTAWLRWKILSENADGRYSYAYAANLSYMLKSDGTPLFAMESAVFFFHARLALAIDGARCVDRSSPESVTVGYESQPYFKPVIERIGKMSKKERAVAILEAVGLEELRGERPLLGQLCTRGTRTMLRAMNAGRAPVEQPSDSAAGLGASGKTYAIDTSGIEAELIPEGQWRTKRREILDHQIRNAAEAL
jgi:hypothetical protein